jgi:hypothetical protein
MQSWVWLCILCWTSLSKELEISSQFLVLSKKSVVTYVTPRLRTSASLELELIYIHHKCEVVVREADRLTTENRELRTDVRT